MITTSANTVRPLPATEPRLGILSNSRRGIGTVIHAADTPGLIAGAELEAGVNWPDDRGNFAELWRFGAPGLARDFAAPAQVSAAFNYSGVVKAVHYHQRQTDLWVPLQGAFQLALFDLRLDSPTFGAINTVFGGDWRPLRLRIPPGVGHGYKVLGPAIGIMVYATDRHYDPSDEGRIPYDDAGLNYAWEMQPR